MLNNDKYIKGNSRVRLAFFAFLGLWILTGIILKKVAEKKIEQLNTMKDAATALNELRNIFLYFLIIPMSIFCLIQGIYFLRLGIMTIKAGVYPPPGINMPFKTRIRRGIMAKISGIICLIGGLGGFVIFPLLMILRHKMLKLV